MLKLTDPESFLGEKSAMRTCNGCGKAGYVIKNCRSRSTVGGALAKTNALKTDNRASFDKKVTNIGPC